MKFYYIIHFQFLGFRYHGWQKQAVHKTIQGTIEECLKKFLGYDTFTVLGASRTDSMVSAQHALFELITPHEIQKEKFESDFNKILPADIKILKIESVDRDFKIISGPKTKEYFYFFSFGEKNHPFSAPFITHINEELDIELMMEAARCFIGIHDFHHYCYKPNEKTNFRREVLRSEIVVNNVLTANFFPEKSFIFKVEAKSFMRYQVRLMMGAILRVGMKQSGIEDLKSSLLFSSAFSPVFSSAKCEKNMNSMIAPASGLILNSISLHIK